MLLENKHKTDSTSPNKTLKNQTPEEPKIQEENPNQTNLTKPQQLKATSPEVQPV